jgi:hypothetical protein
MCSNEFDNSDKHGDKWKKVKVKRYIKEPNKLVNKIQN